MTTRQPRHTMTLVEAAAALPDQQRRDIAAGWLKAAGRPVTDDAVDALAPTALPLTPGSPMDRLAVAWVREGRPIDAEQLRGEHWRRSIDFKNGARARTREVLAFIEATRRDTGTGPAWHTVARRNGLTIPQLHWLFRKLREHQLITHTTEKGSLDLTDSGRELLKATPADAVIDLRNNASSRDREAVAGASL